MKTVMNWINRMKTKCQWYRVSKYSSGIIIDQWIEEICQMINNKLVSTKSIDDVFNTRQRDTVAILCKVFRIDYIKL